MQNGICGSLAKKKRRSGEGSTASDRELEVGCPFPFVRKEAGDMQAGVNCAALEPTEIVCFGWVHAFGVYFPRRCAVKHRESDWSRAVVLAKKRSGPVIDYFGRTIAQHMAHMLTEERGYVIAHVPAIPNRDRCRFGGPGGCATEILANYIARNLAGRADVSAKGVLVQTRPKRRKQRQCESRSERFANVAGIYAVAEALGWRPVVGILKRIVDTWQSIT